METSSGTADFESTMMAHYPGARRLLFRFARVQTLADSLPSIFQLITTSGKLSGLAFLAVYMAIVLLWLPFWVVSKVITEYGVYAFSLAAIFYFGRVVIRMIAFPGASNKVVSEVEGEFAKYSSRMLVAAANCLRELAQAVESSGGRSPSEKSGANGGSLSSYEIQPLWKRAKSYRDRALGVYLEVLNYIYQQSAQSPLQSQSQRTRFGTNRIAGDIGNLSGLTPQARADGKDLVALLKKVIDLMDKLEHQASAILNGPAGNKSTVISEDARATASALLASSNELRDFVSSLKPLSAGDSAGGSDEDLTVDAMRRRVEEQSGSAMDAVKSGLASILPMLDPPPHTSIFGFDVLRGTVLSRYIGARQLWVPRADGGMLDVIHIPARNINSNAPRNTKAVMYCNPNAGLCEVATGMSLAGGNIGEEPDMQDNCWTDFYTELGFDVYLFNYAGFGRSFGTTTCVKSNMSDGVFVPGILGRLSRIFRASFLTFKPTPDTLRADGVALSNFIVRECGVESLLIHGESIGGVAASRSAQQLSLSPVTRSKLSLLVCDRTFCNLEAVAQRLVGNWSGYAIRALAPLWNTDVAGDYLTTQCAKVVANDFADAIVADCSSLKTGVALWRELQRGLSSTKGIGWVPETPVEYRMADWENVSVVESHYVAPNSSGANPPVWPQDKHVSLSEAFHFAACARRIGRRSKQDSGRTLDEDGGVELGRPLGASSSPIRSAWEILACCDGLCGAPLGMAVKNGFDSTIAWLCCCLTYGGQVIVEKSERRLAKDGGALQASNISVIPSDFDQRPEGYESQESAKMIHPKPVPEVLNSLKSLAEANGDALEPVKHEINFAIGMLEYIVARLSSPHSIQSSWKCKHGKPEETMVGTFLNLHCGHNNAFSSAERQQLKKVIQETVGTTN